MESTTPSLGDKRPAQAAEATTSSVYRKKARTENAFTIQETSITFDPSLVAIRMEGGVVTLTPETLALNQTQSNGLTIKANYGDAAKKLCTSLLDIFKEVNAPARWYKLCDSWKGWAHPKSSPLTFEVKLASILWDARKHDTQIDKVLDLKCAALEPATSLLSNNEEGLRCLLIQLGAPQRYHHGAIDDHLRNMVTEGYPGRGGQHGRTAWRHATELTRTLLQINPGLLRLDFMTGDSRATAVACYTEDLRKISVLFSWLRCHIESSFKKGRLEKRVRAKAVEYGYLPGPDTKASEAYYQRLFTSSEEVSSGDVVGALIKAVMVDPGYRSEDWPDDVASAPGNSPMAALSAGLDPNDLDQTCQPLDSAELHPAHHVHTNAQLGRLAVKACSFNLNQDRDRPDGYYRLLERLDELQEPYGLPRSHDKLHIEYIQAKHQGNQKYRSASNAIEKAQTWYERGGASSCEGWKERPDFDLEGPDWLFLDHRLLDMLDGGTYWIESYQDQPDFPQTCERIREYVRRCGILDVPQHLLECAELV